MSAFNQPPIIEIGDLNDIGTESCHMGLPTATVQTHAVFADLEFQNHDNDGWFVSDMDDISFVQSGMPSAPQSDNESTANDLTAPLEVSTEIVHQAQLGVFELPQPQAEENRIRGMPVKRKQARNIYGTYGPNFSSPNFSDRLQVIPPDQAFRSSSTTAAQQAQDDLSRQQTASMDDIQPALSRGSSTSPVVFSKSPSTWQENIVPSTTPISLQAINSSSSSASRLNVMSSNSSSRSVRKKLNAPNSRTVPSHYCHICGRNSRIEFGHCVNIKLGLCRKVVCEKCISLHEPESRQRALDPDSDWLCIHCRHMCPEKARCKQYIKNNHKRRERKARERMERGKSQDGIQISAAGLEPQNMETASEVNSTEADPWNHVNGFHDEGFQLASPGGQPPPNSSGDKRTKCFANTPATQDMSLPPNVSVTPQSPKPSAQSKTCEQRGTHFKINDDNYAKISFPGVSSSCPPNKVVQSIQIISPPSAYAPVPQAYSSQTTTAQSIHTEQALPVLYQNAKKRMQHDGVRFPLTETSKRLALVNVAVACAPHSNLSHVTTPASSLTTRLDAKQAAKLRTTSNSSSQASQTIHDKQIRTDLQPGHEQTDGVCSGIIPQCLPPQNMYTALEGTTNSRRSISNQIISQRSEVARKNIMTRDQSDMKDRQSVKRMHGVEVKIVHEKKNEDQSGNRGDADRHPRVSGKRKRGTDIDIEREGTQRRMLNRQPASVSRGTARICGRGPNAKQLWYSQPKLEQQETNETAVDSRKQLSLDKYANLIVNATAREVVDTPFSGFPDGARKKTNERIKPPHAESVRVLDTLQEDETESCVSPTGILDVFFVRDGDYLP